MEGKIPFLGSGWGFPPIFDKNKRSVRMISDEEDISSSLEILLSTSIGETNHAANLWLRFKSIAV